MGTSICKQQFSSNEKEIQSPQQPVFSIRPPPKIAKLQPIQKIKFTTEEQILVEQELPKSNTGEITDIKAEHQKSEAKIVSDKKISLHQQSLQEQQSSFKDDSGSQLLEVKYRSILKNNSKGQSGSHPTSPKHDSESICSQKSQKKVTFDKKQRVVYSTFRNVKS